jgi:hypothetical protein
MILATDFYEELSKAIVIQKPGEWPVVQRAKSIGEIHFCDQQKIRL